MPDSFPDDPPPSPAAYRKPPAFRLIIDSRRIGNGPRPAVLPLRIASLAIKTIIALHLAAFLLLALLPFISLLLLSLPFLVLWPALFAALRLVEAKQRIEEEIHDPDAPGETLRPRDPPATAARSSWPRA